jgi:microsomal dipeptidase-like Zn-dependent dipeptidase
VSGRTDGDLRLYSDAEPTVLVDLSHVSDSTMRDVRPGFGLFPFLHPLSLTKPTIQAIRLSQAPVIFSHSGARALLDHPRNVPDDILRMIGDEEGQNSGVV